ncbi:similar to Saccharomyces cerevisiae YGL223C COG1 Essential component of the conserved oligomeric Golgi complex (Cog1p through Cog8p) [Maudiozyma saulgeensis]|uniref:Similar to Saccharomyces cerevisiae YGL223C COG1 Essential component of the conserved oligomeric Golgi complex (Cog1p through Cog8p) n=1 Tax=Maudiozyma saulgeensis TaxID=1789683 RepID=A0A1X7QXZ3_9SACH|nr:similar to Saccharomyces cerevisiae YGL223C COG1 Essential component of the conserved oligomeric Golgi complex (Cog1p through Cog8p) [Kazachstania saulgeensis]
MSTSMIQDQNFATGDFSEDIKEEVLDLLKTRTISDVKDYLLDINRKLSVTEEEFNKELKVHYSVILHVIQNISLLHNDLSKTDTEFRELCFNDSLYQISKLPTFEPKMLSVEHHALDSNNNNNNNNDDKDLQSVTLRVTNWVLAVTTFIDRFTNSNDNRNAFFEDMITRSLNLSNDNNESIFVRYQDIIKNKSRSLQEYIVESSIAHRIILNLEQSIDVFNLFHSTVSFFSWDKSLTEQYNNLLYDMILEDYDLESLYGNENMGNINTPSVRDFLQSSLFKNNVIQRLINNIEDQLTQLEMSRNLTSAVVETAKTNEEHDNDYDEEDDMDDEISTIVYQSLMQSMGLTSDHDITGYDNTELIMDQLKSLEDLNADATRVQILRDRLLAYLLAKQKSLPENDKVTQPQNTDDTVQAILDNYNKTNLEDLISQQIKRLCNTATN